MTPPEESIEEVRLHFAVVLLLIIVAEIAGISYQLANIAP